MSTNTARPFDSAILFIDIDGIDTSIFTTRFWSKFEFLQEYFPKPFRDHVDNKKINAILSVTGGPPTSKNMIYTILLLFRLYKTMYGFVNL